MLLEHPEWMRKAKCKGSGVQFVPDRPGGSLKQAVAICLGTDGLGECPVLLECRRAGEENNELGVWGGVVRSTKVFLNVQHARYDALEDARPKKVMGSRSQRP